MEVAKVTGIRTGYETHSMQAIPRAIGYSMRKH